MAMDIDHIRFIQQLEQARRESMFRPDSSPFERVLDERTTTTGRPEPEPASDKKKAKPEQVKGVTWGDIGGQEEAKRQMKEAIELPFTHGDIFKYYGLKPPKGILLYGPPGCGKTMFGKAAATSLASIHKKTAKDGAFVYIKAPEIQDKFVGESEKKIRKLFEDARDYQKKHGYPAVLFFDEADAILPNRSRSTRYESSVVASFLTEMDGMEECGAIVILATNRPDSIDPAIVRDGRIDRKIRIDRPDQETSKTILRMNLNTVPMAKSTPDRLAEEMAREFFSPHRVLFRVKSERGNYDLTLADAINGAMLAGAVSQAVSLALHRDLADNKQSGLRKTDCLRAIDGIQRQQMDIDHSDTAKDLIERMGGGKLIRMEKVRAAQPVEKVEEIVIEDGPANIFDAA